jgi:signal transduction histidine kinase
VDQGGGGHIATGGRGFGRLVSRLAARIGPWSPVRRFLAAFLGMLAVGTLAMGLWVGQQVETGIIDRNAAVTSLYIDSVVSPHLQTLRSASTLTAADIAGLDDVLRTTELGRSIVSFKIWRRDGTILYAGDAGLIGTRHEIDADLARSFAGEITSDISNLSAEENGFERTRWTRLVQTYVPVRAGDAGQIVSVAEFYQLPDALDAAVAAARARAWAVVLAAAVLAFAFVAFMVRRAGATIARQEVRLREQVGELSTLVREVETLNVRLQEAAGETIEIATRERRRISADLHDGPAQAVALTLLRLDAFQDDVTRPDHADERIRAASETLSAALAELRQIAAGLRLPELGALDLGGLVVRAVEDHRRRSGTPVAIEISDLPESAPLPVKIALYRAIQEGLSNATRHGLGADVTVRIGMPGGLPGGMVSLEIEDGGPGMAAEGNPEGLGLVGIRERAALLGGRVELAPGRRYGTRLVVELPLHDSAGEGGSPLWAARMTGPGDGLRPLTPRSRSDAQVRGLESGGRTA